MDKIEVIPVKLNGKNYMAWSFHLKSFVEGQGMLGYLDETISQPTESHDTRAKEKDSTSTSSKNVDEKALATWNQNNANVVT